MPPPQMKRLDDKLVLVKTHPACWVTLHNIYKIPTPLPRNTITVGRMSPCSQATYLSFLHSCEMKSGSGLGTRLGRMLITFCVAEVCKDL